MGKNLSRLLYVKSAVERLKGWYEAHSLILLPPIPSLSHSTAYPLPSCHLSASTANVANAVIEKNSSQHSADGEERSKSCNISGASSSRG